MTIMLLTLAVLTPSAPVEVDVDITGLAPSSGNLYVQLQDRGQYMTQARTAGALVRGVDGGSRRVRIENVPPGDYALSVWHDANANGRFDVAEGGAPQDGYAVSGQPGAHGPATFDQARLSIGERARAVTVRMRYSFHPD